MERLARSANLPRTLWNGVGHMAIDRADVSCEVEIGIMTYYIVPWAGMWHVYRGDEESPAASLAGRDRAEHWCRSDAAAQSVVAEIYHGAWVSRRIPA